MSRIIFFLFAMFLVTSSIAADLKPAKIEADNVVVRVRPHTPSQMKAFYEARGFPQNALAELEHACFMTVSVSNQRSQVLWLEPERWRVTDSRGREIQLKNRDAWDLVWQKYEVSAAARTAFRWTQLPPSRDLHPHEPVGGNISFRPGEGPYTLLARFALGTDKNQGQVEIRIPGLTCPVD